MRIVDFEKAITNLGGGVVIDEFKLRHSHVHQAHGHTDHLQVVWDEFGRGFTAEQGSELVSCHLDNEDGVRPFKSSKWAMKRDYSFDLKFE